MRQMNATPEEFRRALVQAFGAAVSDSPDGLLLDMEGVQLHFALTREAAHRIGALQLAMLRVEVSVRQGAGEAATELLARVDRATLRGGG